jgi:hypothetical protein
MNILLSAIQESNTKLQMSMIHYREKLACDGFKLWSAIYRFAVYKGSQRNRNRGQDYNLNLKLLIIFH